MCSYKCRLIFRALLIYEQGSQWLQCPYPSSCNQIPIWYWLRHKILSSINQLQLSLVSCKPFNSDFLNCPVIGHKISRPSDDQLFGQTGRLRSGVRCTVYTAAWECRVLRKSLQLSGTEIKSKLKLVMCKLEIRSTEISQQSLIK